MASVKHSPNHHRTWLPLILIGCTFITVIAIVYAKGSGVFYAAPVVEEEQSSQALVATYVEDLQAAMTAFETSRAREPFLESLLTMHVPPEYRAVHVQLVIAADGEEYSEQSLLDLISKL